MKDSELLQKLIQLDSELIAKENLAGEHKRKAWNLIVKRKKMVKNADLQQFCNYSSGDIVKDGKFDYEIMYPYRFVELGVIYKARKILFNGKETKEQNLYLENDQAKGTERKHSKAQEMFLKIAESHNVTKEALAEAIGANVNTAIYSESKNVMKDKLPILTLLSSVSANVQGSDFLELAKRFVNEEK